MDRTIFIHAGMHKTGSTAIQMFVTGNRDRLRELGVYLPVAGTEIHAHNHNAIARSVARFDLEDTGGTYDRLRTELAQAGHPQQVLISAEQFSARLGRPLFSEMLARFCVGIGYAPHVIAYVRPQAAAFNSMYAQHVKNWRDVGPFHRYFRTRVEAPMSQLPLLFASVRSDPRFRLTLRPYNRQIISTGLIEDFLSVLGLPADGPGFMRPSDLENVTPGAKTIAAFLHIRRKLAEREPMSSLAILGGLTTPLIAAAGRLGWNGTKFDGIDEIRLRHAQTRFAESNDEFARTAWNKSWHEIFPEEIERQAKPNMFFPKEAPPAERAEFRDFIEDAFASIRHFDASTLQLTSGDADDDV